MERLGAISGRTLIFYIVLIAATFVGIFLTFISIRALGTFGIKTISESFASEFAEYVPLNKGLLKATTYLIFLILIALSSLVFSLNGKRRKFGLFSILALLIFYNGIIGIAALDFKINPITGEPEKCYLFSNGRPVLHDLVAGNPRKFDPKTGRPCVPITPDIARKLSRWENGERPNRIDDSAEPDMYDRALGTPIVWYFRWPNGELELFDNEGFHPSTAEELRPISPEIVQEWLSQKRARKDRVRLEKEKEQSEAAQRNRNIEEARRAGDRCDQLAGNEFDAKRNPSFVPASYELLTINARAAIDACTEAVSQYSNQPRYRYQLARAYQTQKSFQSKQILNELVQQSYGAAFDNLGWILIEEGQINTAITLFRSGAKAGNIESMVSYAGFLLTGNFITRNENEAYKYYLIAAQHGHPGAMLEVEELKKRQATNQIGGAIIKGVLEGMLKK